MSGLKPDREDNFFYLLAGLAILLVTGPVLSELFAGSWKLAAELSFSLLLIVGVWSLQVPGNVLCWDWHWWRYPCWAQLPT